MSNQMSSASQRALVLGNVASKSTGTLAATTIPLFTIAGLIAVTSLVGRVTTAVTVANSYKVQHNPTAGTTKDIFAATDIGTTDTILGEILVATLLATDTVVVGNRGLKGPAMICDTGQIESVSAGTDGVILWVVTWCPLEDNATLVAA